MEHDEILALAHHNPESTRHVHPESGRENPACKWSAM